jgi:hypothetical protein
VATVYALLFAIAGQLGWMSYALGLDGTKISHLILTVFAATTLYCGRLTWKTDGYLRAQGSRLKEIAQYDSRLAAIRRAHPTDTSVAEKLGNRPQELGFGKLVSGLENGSSNGWFCVGLCQSLGLLGTVIGFIMMLKSISGFASTGNGDAQRMFMEMMPGMGSAFVTTAYGLICMIMAGVQFHMLDQAIGRLRK